MKIAISCGRVCAWVLAVSLTQACGSSEEPDREERAGVLDRDYATIAAAGLRADAGGEMAIARGRITAKVDASSRARAGRMSIAERDVPSLLGSTEFRAARSAAASALGTRVDPAREQDETTARSALAALLTEMQLLSAGATRCEQLGDASERCTITLLIIEVKRSEASDTGGPEVTGSLDASAPPDSSVKPQDTSDAGQADAASAPKPTTCGDDFEPNDTSATATPLAFKDSRAEVSAFSKWQNVDYYSVTTVRRDPVLLTLKYSSPNDATFLSMTLHEPNGDTQWIKNPGDDVTEATLRGWMSTSGVGLAYKVEIQKITGQCTPYTLSAELDACTDAFEDNDTSAQAKPLPAGQTQTATMLATDVDWYDISALGSANGSCNIRYTLPKAADLGIAADLQGANGTIQLRNPADNTTEQSTTVQWTARDAPTRLKLSSGFTPTNCLSYTIVCTNT